MYTAAEFCAELAARGADFYAGVPDTVIHSLCNYIMRNPPAGGQVVCSNEGGAIGMAAGHWLATGRFPVVYMQNSGIGNAVNPLMSLADREVYAIPMLLLVGWRGEPGLHDEPQHMKQGRVSKAMFESMQIPCGEIGPDPEDMKKQLDWAFDVMRQQPGPVVLMVRNKCFAEEPAIDAGHKDAGMTREQAIKRILAALPPDTAYVASTGMGPRELYELRDEAGQGHERDFLNAGAMGHASQIALGVAMAQPKRHVACLDGDGALIMHLGGLAVAAAQQCPNFIHILLNNGVHDSVGGQPNLAMTLDFCSLAKTCGYRQVLRATDPAGLDAALQSACAGKGPYFVEVLLARGYRKNLGRPKIPFDEAARQYARFLGACQ